MNAFKRLLRRMRRGGTNREIDPDEIFLDSSNLPQFDTNQFEGRLVKPISQTTLIVVGTFFIVTVFAYTGKVWFLQIKQGEAFSQRSENNRLHDTVVFADRGAIFDRNNAELAWNSPGDDSNFSLRKYVDEPGLAHVLGYVKYPSKDSYGFYYREDYEGKDGVEKYYNELMRGINGTKIVETNALGRVQSENVMKPPAEGKSLVLSIDHRVQSELYKKIEETANKVGFSGGAGVIMNVKTGEVLAITSFPEYSPAVLTEGKDHQKISEYLQDKNKPFLDRVIDGLYTPGSIVKPYVALGALVENVISPTKELVSTGSISIPNQYDPTKETVFRDWKAHGWIDMRHALAVSSDVYFYEVGGGYKDQKGIGILNIDKYTRMFGLGETVPNSFFTGGKGTIPTPEWKRANFDGDDWRVGDTYHTAIGQYGFQVTPMQMVRAVAAIANSGRLIYPTILKSTDGKSAELERTIDIPDEDFKVIHEGMRLSAQIGTSAALNKPYVEVAGKSGTAELGAAKEKVNSWITGYFPYNDPQYAFAIIMEKGSVHNLVGAGVVMGEMLDWMNVNTPEYFHATSTSGK